MLNTKLTPLRTTVGAPIPITSIALIGSSVDGFQPDEVRIVQRGDVQDARTDPWYTRFMPPAVSVGPQLAPLEPNAGVATIPPPAGIPDTLINASCWSIMALPKEMYKQPPRVVPEKAWLEFEIVLDLSATQSGLVGGICFAGCPFLPYAVDAHGRNTANFGIPRELRLTWNTPGTDGFLDSDDSLVRQQMSSHAGVHYLCTGPLATNRLRLYVTDLPQILRRFEPMGPGFADDRLELVTGILLSCVYAFEYREGVQYQPAVPGALLAAIQVPANTGSGFFAKAPRLPAGFRREALAEIAAPTSGVQPPISAPVLPEELADLRAYCADTVLRVETATGPSYAPMSAASLFGQRRTYSGVAGGQVGTIQETFLSRPLRDADDEVILFIEQAGELPRCVAGLKVRPAPKPLWTADSPRMDVEVYEVDPAEGVAPLDPACHPFRDKYSRRLCSIRDVRLAEGPQSLRFVRTTSCQTLCMIIRGSASQTTAFTLALEALELVQSAHVEVVQRPARNQVVRALNLRLVGTHLAADYSMLGSGGFRFSVEHHADGRQKRTLFEAHSLADLLATGAAQLHANPRYLETAYEESADTTTTLAGSYQPVTTFARADGWSRSTTGKDVNYSAPPDTGGVDSTPPLPPTGHPGGFLSYSSAETRTLNELLPPESGAAMQMVQDTLTGLKHGASAAAAELSALVPSINLTALNSMLQIPTGTAGSMFSANFNSPTSPVAWAQVWKGTVEQPSQCTITGLTVYSVPPGANEALKLADRVLGGLRAVPDKIAATGTATTPADAVTETMGGVRDVGLLLAAMSPLGMISGFGVSVSGGMSAGGSVNISGTGGVLVLEATGGYGVNMGGSYSGGYSVNYNLPTIASSFTTGTTGSIARSAVRSGFSYSQMRNAHFETGSSLTRYGEGEMRRQVARSIDLANRVQQRSMGAQIRWQGDPQYKGRPVFQDIVTLSIPLNIELRATAGHMYATTDETIRVRFPNGLGDLEVDVAFDLVEEVIRDDH